MAGLGEGRFLGWREWTSADSGQDGDPQGAIWSDEDSLRHSDGFDLAKWQRELDGLGFGGGGAPRRNLRARQYRHPAKGQPAPAALPWLPLLPPQGPPAPAAPRPRRPPRGGSAYAAAPGLPALSGPPRGPAEKVPTTTAAELSAAALSEHDSKYDDIARGTVSTRFRLRDRRKQESACQIRSHADNVGKEHRRRAAAWRARAVQRSPDKAHTLSTASEKLTYKRQSRLKDAIARIQSRNDVCGDQLKPPRRPSFADLVTICSQRSSVVSFEPSSFQEQVGDHEEADDESSDDEDQDQIDSRDARLKLYGEVMKQLVRKKRREYKAKQLRQQQREAFEEMPAEERDAITEVCKLYEDKGRILVRDVPQALAELGLRGNKSSERFSVDNAVRHLSAALITDNSSRPSAAVKPEMTMVPAEHDASDPRCTLHANVANPLWPVQDRPAAASPARSAGSLSPAPPAERHQRRSSSFWKDEGSKGIFVEDFCAVVVPAAHAELHSERADAHFQEFMKVVTDDENMTITLDVFREMVKKRDFDPDCLEAALKSVVDRAEARAEEALAASDSPPPRNPGALKALGAFSRKAAKNHRGGAGIASLVAQVTRDAVRSESRSRVRLDFEAVSELLTRLEEQTERAQRKHEWDVKVSTGLSDQVFWKFRPELLRLHSYFHLFDMDQSGFLSQEEVRVLLKRIGLQPYSPEVARVVDNVFGEVDLEGGDLNFATFIGLMEALRAHQRGVREPQLRQVFRKFDKDGDGFLTPEEIADGLTSVGIITTREQQLACLRIAESMDTDGSTLLGFPEFEVLAQRMVEAVSSARVEEDLRLGRELGFEADQVASYHGVFDHLDADGSGALSMAEVELALRVFISRPPTEPELIDVFASIDTDFDGTVQFSEFLQLMSLVQARKGIFGREEPFRLLEVPAEKQRDILRLFPISELHIRNLELGELLETVSDFLGVKADENLKELAEPVKSVRQLLEYARKQAKRDSCS